MNYDDILKDHIGELGLYQVLLVLFISYLAMHNTFNALDYIFISDTPDFRCDVGDISNLESNFSTEQLLHLISPKQNSNIKLTSRFLLPDINQSVMVKNLDATHLGFSPFQTGLYQKHDERILVDSCQMYARNYTELSVSEAWQLLNRTQNDAIACTKWIYNRDKFTATVVTEWDLVCDREWLVATSQSVYMAAKMIVFLGGFIADRLGRRRIILAMSILNVLARAMAALAPNYVVFVIARFFMAFAGSTVYSTIFILAVETVGPKWRTLAGQAPYLFWSVGYMVLPVIAYFIRDWKKLYWALLAFHVPVIFYFCFLPESIRWLQSKKKKKQTWQLLKRMAKINKRELPKDLELFKQNGDKDKRNTSFWKTIKKSTYLLKVTGILIFLWNSVSLTYFGLVFYLPKLGGNIFISTVISGALEIPALLLVQLSLDTRLGRRLCTTGSFITGGLALLAIIVVPKDKNWLVITLALVGRFMTVYVFSAVYIYTSELYPTSIRATGLTICSTTSRIGAVFSPYMFLLNKYYKYLPEIIFGVLTISAGLLTLLLQETLGENLLEDHTELEKCKDLKPENDNDLNLLKDRKTKDIDAMTSTTKI